MVTASSKHLKQREALSGHFVLPGKGCAHSTGPGMCPRLALAPVAPLILPEPCCGSEEQSRAHPLLGGAHAPSSKGTFTTSFLSQANGFMHRIQTIPHVTLKVLLKIYIRFYIFIHTIRVRDGCSSAAILFPAGVSKASPSPRRTPASVNVR